MNLENKNCVKCPLSELRNCVLNGTGNLQAKIVFVFDCPGYEDEREQQSFKSSSASKVDSILARFGVHRSQVFYTYATRCRANIKPNGNFRPAHWEEIQVCNEYLAKELLEIKPNIIVPMGAEAISAVLGIKKVTLKEYRGIEVWSDKFNCKVLPTYAPGAVLRSPGFEETMVQDIRRAIVSSAYPELTSNEKGNYVVIDSIEAFDAFYERVMQQQEVAIDLETTGFDWQKDKIICCSFSWAANTGVLLPVTKWIGVEHENIIIKQKKVTRKKITSYQDVQVIEKTIEDTYHPWWGDNQEYIMKKFREIVESDIKFVAQNGKFDWKFFFQMGWNPKPLAYDTLLMHYLLRETGKGEHNLEDMSLQYLGKGQHKKELEEWFCANGMKEEEDRNYARVPTDLLFSYGSADADVTLQLKNIFLPRIQEEGMLDLLHYLVMPLNYVITHMEYEGFQIDRCAMDKAKAGLQAMMDKALADIKTLLVNAGVIEEVDIDSPKQLSKLLFETLHFQPIKVNKTGYSTDEEVLNVLAEKYRIPDPNDATKTIIDPNNIPSKILEFRGIAKLLRTYVLGIEDRLDDNSRLHTKFLQEGTESGRLSSRDPNFQNFPRDSKLIKNQFVVDKDNILIEADEGQNEFRWWCIYSNDPQMVADLNAGLDIHKFIASVANKIPMSQVTKKQRQVAKSIVFGLMFNMGTEKLSKDHGVTIEYAEHVKSVFFSRYPVAKQWKYDMVKFARKNLYVQNRFGRRRHLLAINHQDNEISYPDQQGAVNSPIQGAASDYVSNAANKIFERIRERGLHGKLRDLIHDAIYIEVPRSEMEETIRIMNEAMTERILGIQIPLIAEFKIGKRWGRMHALKPKLVDQIAQKQVVTSVNS